MNHLKERSSVDLSVECKTCRRRFAYVEALLEHSRVEHGTRRAAFGESHLRRNALIVITILVIVFASYNLLGSTPSPQPSQVAIGEASQATILGPSLDFTLTDIDGKTFSLRDLRGKIVVMHLVVPNCPSCAAQNLELRKIASRYGPDKVAILSISIDPNESDLDLQAWRIRYQITWIVARDTAGLFAKLRITTSSTLFLLDKDGLIRYRHEQVTPSETISREIEMLLR